MTLHRSISADQFIAWRTLRAAGLVCVLACLVGPRANAWQVAEFDADTPAVDAQNETTPRLLPPQERDSTALDAGQPLLRSQPPANSDNRPVPITIEGSELASPPGNTGPAGTGLQPVPFGQQEMAPPPSSVTVPLTAEPLPERTVISAAGQNVTLIVRNGSLSAVLNAIAEHMNLNIVSASNVTGQVSVTLTNVPLEDALEAILSVNGYRWIRNRNIILISSLDATSKVAPSVQGREVRVFRLNFVSAMDVDKTVSGLLSPVGTSYVTEVDPLNKRRTREELVVEDLPEYLDRIEAYVQQADCPPAQVLIEAYVLQVALRDNNRHGVNLQNLASLSGADVALGATGFANAAASPAFIINLDGRRLDALVEMIRETTDAKTLATPKVLAVNGQEARVQIGESLGYLTTTTTQTSTLQQVNFLDLGVVLTVTPVIGQDGRILMTVKPEVSSGRINPTTQLPDSETTEVESTVLIPSGHAMVVGGLITEENTDQQARVPIIGSIPGLGKLFQRRNRVRDRSEIIIALVPRIVPYGEAAQYQHAKEVQRATTPLVYDDLQTVDRSVLEPRIRGANQSCEVPGRGMQNFASVPPAYSPYTPAVPHVIQGPQYLPPVIHSPHAKAGSGQQLSGAGSSLPPPVRSASVRLPEAASAGQKPSQVQQTGWTSTRRSR
ncbi:MAG: hypothetical protein Fues2KO_45710 [Fuerstiella sp.]